MNPNILSYKGYWSKLEFSQSDKVFHGKIEGISDLVTFESESAREIEAEFHNAVDDYLSFCQDVGKSPDKSYNGSFNIRISPTLHKDLARLASISNQSINSFVEQAISDKVYGNSTKIEEIFIINRLSTEIQSPFLFRIPKNIL